MGEVINNIKNQQQTGPDKGAGLKQNVFNENRNIMVAMLAPVS
jgi:hypothetical protein